jgi:hypothetical protein
MANERTTLTSGLFPRTLDLTTSVEVFKNVENELKRAAQISANTV